MYHVMLNYQVAIRFLAIECFSNVFDFNRLFVSKIYSRGAKVAPPLAPFASPATPRSPQCRRSPSVAHASGKEFYHHLFCSLHSPTRAAQEPQEDAPAPESTKPRLQSLLPRTPEAPSAPHVRTPSPPLHSPRDHPDELHHVLLFLPVQTAHEMVP
jgi:hypothetical protein